MAPVPRQQLVPVLLTLRRPLRQQAGGKQPLRQVVDTAVPLAAHDRDDPGLRQRLEQRADLVGGPPVPVDRLAGCDVGGRERSLVPHPPEELLDQRRVLVERLAAMVLVPAIPGDAVPRQLGGRHDREHLVVRLVQGTVAVEEVVRPRPAVAVDAGQEDQVVIATGDLERVELQRAQAVDDAHDRARLSRQRARRGEEVARDEEAPRDRGGQEPGLGAHVPRSYPGRPPGRVMYRPGLVPSRPVPGPAPPRP